MVLGYIRHSYHCGTPVKVKEIPIQDYYRPIWFQEIGSSQIFRQSTYESCRLSKRLSALRTGSFNLAGNISITLFC